MKKNILLLLAILLIISCKTKKAEVNHLNIKAIHQVIDQWHIDVATFNYEAYFNKMTDDAIFVGTDSNEVWSKKEFQNFCKPYFDKKTTWNFKPLKRNIYSVINNIAWFDETLETWMGVCRGSGVLIYNGNSWKIKHYVLSITVPNESVKEVITLKKQPDILFINSLKNITQKK